MNLKPKNSPNVSHSLIYLFIAKLNSNFNFNFNLSFEQLSQNKFFDPSTPSMRKGRERGKKRGEKKKRLMIILATTSLPAVNRQNADRWNTACSCQ